MAKRNRRGGAPAAAGANGAAPSEVEKIRQKAATKRAKKADAPDVRDLSEIEAAQARAILAEKQLMEERKKVLQLQDQLLKAQQANLQLRAEAHNREASAKDQERSEFLAALGVEAGDKADFAGDKLVIQRGGAKQ